MSRRIALASTLVLALCAPGVVRAQDAPIDGHAYLAEASWGRLPADAPAGQKFYVTGRWESCWGNLITLHKMPAPARGFFRVTNEAMRLQLAANMLPGPGRVRLAEKKDNVRMFGHLDRVEGRLCLVIDRVVKLEDDMARFTAALERAGEDPQRIAAVARELLVVAQKFEDAELRELHERAKQRELGARRQGLADDDHRGWATLAAEYAQANDRATAIALYAHVVKNTREAELRNYVLDRLAALGARQTRTGWTTYEEYKQSEGFIGRKERDGTVRWLTKEQAEFEDARLAVQRQTTGTLVLFRQSPLQHGNNAAAGKLEKGQTAEEARMAAGQPVHVAHVRAADSLAPDARAAWWTQWVWADGRRAYFLQKDGESAIMVDMKTPKDAWPR